MDDDIDAPDQSHAQATRMEEPQPEVHDVAQQDAAGDTASANGEAGAGDVRAIADESDPPTEHLEDESEAVDTEDRDAASDEEEAASANGDSDSDGTDSTASEEVAPKDWKEQLEYEIKAGALDKVEAILDNEDNEGALEIRFEYQFRNISKPTEGVTPLILAATLGHTEIVKLLMKRGADIRATTTTYSYTAFALAAHEGQLEVVKAILEHRKAELEDDEKPEDILECRAGNDETPLIFASWYGRGPVVDYLISEGADVTAKDNDNNTGLHHAAWEGSIDPTTSLLNADPSIVDWRNDSEETAFLLTARNGALAVAEFLLEKGASLTARDIGESTILHLSAWYGHLDMVKKFLAVRSQFLEERDKSGRTPFLRACWEGHVDVVAYLIEQGADMLVKAQGGETAFQAATAEGHLQVVKKLYDSHPEFLDMKRDDGQTALILAAWTWHLDIVKYLMDQKADIHAKDAEGDNILNNVVFPENGKPETVLETLEYLLDKGARLDSNNTGRNAFQIAAYAGKEDVVKLFLDALSKDPDSDGGPMPSHYYTAKDTWGDTALTDAASKDHISVVLAILESIIFIPPSPAIDDAYICNEKEMNMVSELFMDLLTAKEEESRKGDDDGETRADQIKLVENHLEAVLYWAVQNGKHELAEICVQKNPKLVYLDKGGASLLHIAAIGGNVNIMDRLLQKRLQDQDDLMTRLFEQNLLKTRPEHLKHKLPFAVKKVTPFHLAVRYSNLEMVESLLSWVDDEPKEEGTSPPAANFPLNIDQARPELTSVLKTILQMTDDGDTPISLAASGNTGTHRDIEEILWKRLYNSIQRNPWFFYDPSTPQAPLSPEAERVLELAAQFENPRDEFYLRKFLQRMPQRVGHRLSKDPNTLQLAVYHQVPTVVWWLLSNGGYMSENDMREALQLSERVKRVPFGTIIHELLTDPPPVLKRRARRDDHRPPTFQHARQEYDSPNGTVLDFYDEDHQVTFQIKRRPLHDIIYQDGPQKIMTATQFSDLSSLKKAVSGIDRDRVEVQSKDKTKETKGGLDHDGARQNKPTADNAGSKRPTENMNKQRVPDLRWIHLPVNNLRCVEELMVRISLDKDVRNKEHRALSQFVRKSWAELPAGKRKTYMKPQCVYDGRLSEKSDNRAASDGEEAETQQTDTSKPEKRVALYMPYVFWTQWPLNMPGRSDTDLPQVSENQPTPRAPIVHNSLTLDQYYYVSLKDTAKRDRDQVLWRFMEVEKQRLRLEEERKLSGYKREATSRVERHYNEAQAEAMELKIEKVVGSTQILIVNQLWLWILDEKTIITSTTKEPEGIESSFFQRVLTTLRAQERSSWLSVEYVTELILSTATGMFNKKEIKFLDLKKSPLDVYRESILNVRDAEAELFDRFRQSLKSANPSDSRSRSLSRADTTAAKTTSYAKWDSLGGRNGTLQAKIRRAQLTQDLEKEPRIMQTEDKTEEKPPKQELGGSIWEQLKNWWNRKDTDSQKDSNPYHDIAREAELLREVKDISDELNMLKNLAEDQEGVWKQFWVPGTTPRTTYTYDTPSEIKGEIEEMIKEAEFVQQAIDTLLDLKQKQANITEAQYSRKQSDDTATQSDTVMVFTVVTILFLPASFLTSLFALNVSDFPHEGGNVSYQGYWIFPIIFGVSILVSGFFAVVAFNASAVKKYWAGRSKRRSPKRDRVERPQLDRRSLTLEGSSGSDTLV